MSGFIKLSRNIESWEFRSDPLAMALWINLLLMAEWKDSEETKAGELVISSRKLSEITGISRDLIFEWLNRFEQAGQVKTEPTAKGTRIQLLNYGKYLSESGRNIDHFEEDSGREIDHKRSKYRPQAVEKSTTQPILILI